MKQFEDYSQEHVNFYEPGIVPKLIKKAIIIAKNGKKKVYLADIGCGDANILHQILNLGLLKTNELVGVEPSAIRIERSNKEIKIVKGTAEKIPFKNNVFDIVISNQVIEHILNEKPMLNEVKRILKKNGLFYVSSVVKKPYGVWIYTKNGKFVSDPTHYREYQSKNEFEKLIKNCGFEIVETKMALFKHPLTDLFIRSLIKAKIVKPENALRMYEKNKLLFWFRNNIKWPMFGFYNVEVLAKKIN